MVMSTRVTPLTQPSKTVLVAPTYPKTRKSGATARNTISSILAMVRIAKASTSMTMPKRLVMTPTSAPTTSAPDTPRVLPSIWSNSRREASVTPVQ